MTDTEINRPAPWEATIRTRLSLAIKSAQLLREGRRTDREAVIRELQNLWDGISFVVTLWPEMANDWTVATARDIIAGRVAEIALADEKTAHDDDEGEAYDRA